MSINNSGCSVKAEFLLLLDFTVDLVYTFGDDGTEEHVHESHGEVSFEVICHKIDELQILWIFRVWHNMLRLEHVTSDYVSGHRNFVTLYRLHGCKHRPVIIVLPLKVHDVVTIAHNRHFSPHIHKFFVLGHLFQVSPFFELINWWAVFHDFELPFFLAVLIDDVHSDEK